MKAEKGLNPSQTPPLVPFAIPTNEAAALPQQKRDPISEPGRSLQTRPGESGAL